VARPASPTKVIEADGRRFLYDRATNGLFEASGASPRLHRLAFDDSPAVRIVARRVEFVITGGCTLPCGYCPARRRDRAPTGYEDLMDEPTASRAVGVVEKLFGRRPLLVEFLGGGRAAGAAVIRSVMRAFEGLGIACETRITRNRRAAAAAGTTRCDEWYCRFEPARVRTAPTQVLTFWPDGKISACVELARHGDLVFGGLGTVDERCRMCWAMRYCPHVGCYKLFAENGCLKGWRQEAQCIGIRQDLERRMQEFVTGPSGSCT
jgi:hypothetical protein